MTNAPDLWIADQVSKLTEAELIAFKHLLDNEWLMDLLAADPVSAGMTPAVFGGYIPRDTAAEVSPEISYARDVIVRQLRRIGPATTSAYVDELAGNPFRRQYAFYLSATQDLIAKEADRENPAPWYRPLAKAMGWMLRALSAAKDGDATNARSWADRVCSELRTDSLAAYQDKLFADADAEQLVWIGPDRTASFGTVADLAHYIDAAQLCGEDGPTEVYAVGPSDRLTPVEVKVTSTGYDEDDYAQATVTVTLPSGVTAAAGYRIDGRA